MEETEEVNEIIEKETSTSSELTKKFNRCSQEEFIEVIKENLVTCKECNIQFLKRKKNMTCCPVCHTEF